MQPNTPPLQALEDIRQMMTKSSRFISLSGWSGVAAGVCALVGAWVARTRIGQYQQSHNSNGSADRGRFAFRPGWSQLELELLLIAVVTLAAAALLAFLFTYIRSQKTGVPIWGFTARKLMMAVAVPMLVGGLLILRLIDYGAYGLVAPASLLFYGLSLVNARNHTVPEIGYLGYFQLLLGLLNLWYMGYGLYFWAAGFGLLHILYGIIMWNRYERAQ